MPVISHILAQQEGERFEEKGEGEPNGKVNCDNTRFPEVIAQSFHVHLIGQNVVLIATANCERI